MMKGNDDGEKKWIISVFESDFYQEVCLTISR